MKKTLTTLNKARNDLYYYGLKFLSAGHYEPEIANAEKMDLVTKYIIFNAFLIVGFSIFVPFTFLTATMEDANYINILLYSVLCIILLALFILTRTKIRFAVLATILIYLYVAFVIYMLIQHPTGGSAAALWTFILPPLAFYLSGSIGIIPSTVVALAMIYAFGSDPIFYQTDFTIRCSVIYAFTVAFASLTYKRTQVLSLSLVRSRERLKNELDEIETMKDNLNVGIFLLDSKLKIQPFYSRYLPIILSTDNLDYADFLSILSASLKNKEINLLKDYFELVINSTHNIQTLQDVNPLQKFNYITDEGKEKILSITFTQIQRQNGEKVILSVAQDITAESKMEQRLAAEEELRQTEMNTMFEIMQVSPQILHEFLEELEIEFKNINSILKNTSHSVSFVCTELYQKIHAIKSNALVIGLNSVSERLHAFEDKLSSLIEQNTTDHESMLGIVFELERIMKIKDDLRTVLEKLTSFSSSANSFNSPSDVLIQAIKNTIEKATQNEKKIVYFNVKSLYWDEIEAEYRKILKDILIQLTRNAVAHGIESTVERENNNKAKDANITLSIEKKKETLVIKFFDDGKGIDFVKVKSLVKDKKLYSKESDLDNQNFLIKALFSPGFSTANNKTLQAGRGIGLNLVSKYVKDYKGSIKVKSTLNKGTLLLIEIPYK